MKNFTLMLGLVVAFACSGGDSGSETGAVAPGGTPSVDAAGEWADDAIAEEIEAESANASDCLELVADGSYAEALSPCTIAAQESPDNTEIAEALAEAEANATAAAAEEIEAASDALTEAMDDASSQIDGASKALTDDM